ncbi:hypothetical protein BR93DRAFT_930521 [Coniochaeta sp. PMI_546]|nr:hypothetical protein BR93DRAFT_930521 [Coniochaeta sp. PMI_546]
MLRQPRLWSWAFLRASVVLDLLTPLLYCVFLSKCSAVVAFGGSVTFIVFQAMVVAGKPAGEVE